jgi:hypothetical protein
LSGKIHGEFFPPMVNAAPSLFYFARYSKIHLKLQGKNKRVINIRPAKQIKRSFLDLIDKIWLDLEDT